MKRLLSLSVFLMMALLSLAHDFEVKNAVGKTIYYNITSSSDLTVAVTYQGTSYSEYSNEYNGDVTIPESVSYGGNTYSVTSIGSYAFYYCKGLTSVTIPNSVTSIGDYAFFDCSGLTKFTIPNSVTSIGIDAFYGTAWYNNQPEGLIYLGKVAYKYKGTMPKNTVVVLEEGTTGISGNAFYNCSGLTSVEIPNSVTSIGSSAFEGCSGLTSITIPNSVTSIGSCAFYYCKGLTSVTIPNSVTAIGSSAFSNCSSLTSIEIPNSVTSIGWGVFRGCSGLTSVTIPNSVTSIDNFAFRDCSGLKKVIVPDIAVWCNISFIDPYGNPLYYAKHIYSDENTEITDLVIPNGVTSIGNYAFEYCSSLTSITIPNSVTSIGNYAFYNCSSLTSVTIPNSVTSIGKSAFYICSGLTSITIPNSVTSIGSNAFRYCSGLTSVTIPNSVTSIGNGAFSDCGGLTSIEIPNSVTTIGSYAFSNCSGLTSVTIPNSVTSIGSYAFSGCKGLTSVTIPNSVTSIGSDAFSGCRGLTSVTIPNRVTSIGSYAFSGCKGLTSIEIPNSVTTIGSYAFSGCRGLTSVNIPNSVTSIGFYAFGDCSGLKSITIPNSVTSIGDYAFSYCSGMKEIISYINKPNYIYSHCWEGVYKSIPLYVPAGSKEKYQSTGGWEDFTNIIEFGGERIEPLTEPQEVVVAVVPDQISLNGMVVGDTYYVLDAENGDGADSENGCVVINTTTTEEAVDGIAGKDISDASVKAVFKGIIFMVPAGTGTVSINAETLGTSSLMVKIGSQLAQAFQLAERETVEIPYNVAEPTYVYIYAGTGTQAARSVGAARAAAAENSVKVYSYKWEPTDPTGISSVDNSQAATGNEAGDWYTIDGRKLSGKPAQKGIYIVNGRKVAVK